MQYLMDITGQCTKNQASYCLKWRSTELGRFKHTIWRWLYWLYKSDSTEKRGRCEDQQNMFVHLTAKSRDIHGNLRSRIINALGLPNYKLVYKALQLYQWEFQDPKLEVPTIYKAYVRGYPPKMWPYMVQYLHFRILEFPLNCRYILNKSHKLELCTNLLISGPTGRGKTSTVDHQKPT